MPRRFPVAVGCVLSGIVLWTIPVLAEGDTMLPMRKAGLWELKTVMDEGLGPRDQTLTICVDADMEKNTVRASYIEHKRACSKYDIDRDETVTRVDATCKFSNRHVESKTEMSGDFQSALLVKIKSTTSGKERGQSVSVKRTITQTGKYLGQSCGDLSPGEAKGSDGSRIMVQ
jgi:Protein of unknown function (DUF3617)